MDRDSLQPSDLRRLLGQPCCATGSARSSTQPWLEADQVAGQRESGWNKDVLRVAFGACAAIAVHSDVSVADAQSAVQRAMETWNGVALPIRFEAADNSDDADIVVAWEFTSGDPDGGLSPWTQAHADFPPGNSLYGEPPLPLHFNADFLWGVETDGCFDIETIALHELGHCLGLIYHSGRETIMYEAIREAPLFVRHRLDEETIARARDLYERSFK